VCAIGVGVDDHPGEVAAAGVAIVDEVVGLIAAGQDVGFTILVHVGQVNGVSALQGVQHAACILVITVVTEVDHLVIDVVSGGEVVIAVAVEVGSDDIVDLLDVGRQDSFGEQRVSRRRIDLSRIPPGGSTFYGNTFGRRAGLDRARLLSRQSTNGQQQ